MKALGIILFCNLAVAAAVEGPFQPLPKAPPAPKNNPITTAKVELGKQLFHDPRISKDGTVSCASCHNVMLSGGDNRAFSAGVDGKLGGRSAPTVFNAALHSVQFWDGRAATLEDQAKGPMTNPVEMAMPNHDEVIARLKQIPGYVASFDKVFGKNALNIDNVAKAIATYERTLLTPSRFDKFLRGDKNALNAQEKRGYQLVQDVGCITCHNGPNANGPVAEFGQFEYRRFPTFTDNEYVKKYDLLKDKGRAEHTKNTEEDSHMWRVASWRNVAITAPYFHNGSVKTLDEAVRLMAKVQLNKDLKEDQVADIVAFLGSLTGELPKQTMPQLPPTVKTSLVGG